MDCGWCDGHAAGLPRTQRAGADGSGAVAVVGPRLRVSRTARRHREGAVVRRRWTLPAGQVTGFTLHLFRFDPKVLFLFLFYGPVPDLRSDPNDCCAWLVWNLVARRGTRAHCGRAL